MASLITKGVREKPSPGLLPCSTWAREEASCWHGWRLSHPLPSPPRPTHPTWWWQPDGWLPPGVKVVCTDGGCHDSRGPQPQNRWPQRRLPFADATFDLVLVSSVSFCPREVYRVLKSGGTLLTSQAGTGKDGPELVDLLEGTPPEWSLPENRWDIDATLDEAGFLTVEKLEGRGSSTYRDIGAVVYYLKAVPWVITDFDVDRYRERLYRLHLRMKAEGGLTTVGVHRIIEVRKP